MKNIKLIIFDFDGTLADTKNLWKNTNLSVFKQEKIKNYKKLVKQIIHEGRKIKPFLIEIGIDKKKAEKIAKRIHKIVFKKKIKFVPEIKEIEKIKIKKVVVSNSFTKILKSSLKGIRFDGIYGGELFNKKEEFFKKLFKKYRIKNYECAYIGDRYGDVLTARKAKCVSVIISNKYSWNSRKEILKAKPDFVIKNLREVRKLFKPFFSII